MPVSSRDVLRRITPAVPEALAARAERWSPQSPAAPPQLSASVILVRGPAVETFLLHRHARMSFAASMAVFPGGRLEPAVDQGPDPVRSCAVREAAEETGVLLQAAELLPWAHWTTPEPEPRRFETAFFLAALPAGQVARDLSTETDRADWTTPRAALESAARGELGLMPPTLSILTELADAADVADLIRAAGERVVEPVLPRLRRAARGWVFDYGLDP